MGREKEYRQRLKYQVASTQKKTLKNQLQVELEDNLGLAPAESELLSERIYCWFCGDKMLRNPNQIIIRGAQDRRAFSRKVTDESSKKITITPFHHEDLELELEFGLKTLQLGRCLRIIEEAYRQNSLLSSRKLTLLLNITPTSLRSRLKRVRELGVWAPTRGLAKKDREGSFLLRSSWILRCYLENRDLQEARKEVGLGKQRFHELLRAFAQVVSSKESGRFDADDPEHQQWLELANSASEKKLKELSWFSSSSGDQPLDLREELHRDFGFSPVKIRAIFGFLSELKTKITDSRGDTEIIYWAVSTVEPAGKPICECRLVPARIGLLNDDDLKVADPDLNRLRDIKLARILRYATETKHAGGYLTYADLSYLMGINTNSLSALVKKNPQLVVPLRGAECDIGRGTTHRRKIIELYLQMHTESQIVTRTGHSYEAVENYINEFATVWVLRKRGLPPPMIRKVTGRSMMLIRIYLELIEEYSAPEYAFKFQQLERIFDRHEPEFKKGGPLKL